jgi:hypothetical protein
LEDVRAFQVYLVSTGISWPALNQTVCALRFFYGVTLGHGEIPERIAYAREPRKLPIVLNADEVVRFLEVVPSLKTRAALTCHSRSRKALSKRQRAGGLRHRLFLAAVRRKAEGRRSIAPSRRFRRDELSARWPGISFLCGDVSHRVAERDRQHRCRCVG